MKFRVAVLTVSTSAFLGKRDDTSGRTIQEILNGPVYECLHYEIVPDDKNLIADKLVHWADVDSVDLVITTGGTGLAPTDVTPDACLSIMDREVPGMANAMRHESGEITPMAMLSRSVACTRGKTLILTLPGSTRGVRECLKAVSSVIPHALELLNGGVTSHDSHPNDVGKIRYIS